MLKVRNNKCLSNISGKSMMANKKRNIILLIAIVLTTVMLTTLFTVGSSIMKSIEISTTYQVGTSSHAGFKFLTQEEYDELATDNHIYDLSYNIEAAEEYISDYCDNISPGLDYTSRKTYLKDFNNTISTFLVIGGALSVILALIAILNFINLTYTSIHERKQELMVLGAIGMTKKQIAAMLSYEGVFRVLLTFAIVLTIGQLLNYVIVYLMAGEMIMFSYKYVVWPMLLCIPVFLIIATVIPRIIGRNNINLAS